MNRRYCCSNDILPLSYLYHITEQSIIQGETKNICPPSNACANSADAPYIPSPKGRGFTAHWGNPTSSDVKRAARFLILAWQSYGSRADGKNCGWKKDVVGREAAYAVRCWNHLPGWIVAAQERLKQVQIEHKDALQLIRQFNHPKVLIYCDPPYVLSTRSCKHSYRNEMDDAAHEELLDLLNQHRGSVMLSGYANELYDKKLQGWARYDVDMVITSGAKRQESLWVKEVIWDSHHRSREDDKQISLFGLRMDENYV